MGPSSMDAKLLKSAVGRSLVLGQRGSVGYLAEPISAKSGARVPFFTNPLFIAELSSQTIAVLVTQPVPLHQ